ncbi:MAG: TetR/AcrR family transcriptional regulator [Faecousia sp.]
MYKACKTEQSAARQRELEQGLLAAMISHPFDEISISDLCTQIGIPRKSFYRYFSSKEGALHALLDHTLMEMETVYLTAEGDKSVPFTKELERFFQDWKDKKPLLDALNRSGLSNLLIERAVELAVSSNIGTTNWLLFREGNQQKGHATAFLICGLMSTVLQWHHSGYQESPAQMAQIAFRLLTQPLIPEQKP